MYSTSGQDVLFANKTERVKKERKRLLFIDSRDKDVTFTDPFSYTIFFDNQNSNQNSNQMKSIGVGPMYNVSQIEIKAINFPRILQDDSLTYEQYGILSIKELKDPIDSTDVASHRTSCVFFFDGTDSPQTIYPIEGNGRIFKPTDTIRSLDRLTIEFRKYGSKEPLSTSNTEGSNTDHSILFEITTLV
jgi:hypothetical protein